MNLLILGGIGTAAYLLFGDKIKQAFKLLDINTFGITGIKNINFKSFPTLKFDVTADYNNNTDITIPIDNIVVKVYKVVGDVETEISNSRPNAGVTLKAKETTNFSIPMSINLSSSGISLFDILGKNKPTLRVRVWITAKGATIEDVSDFKL